MKATKTIYSFILHGFLGFLWIILITTLLDLFNSTGRTIWMGIFIAVGTILFLDITSRVFESFSTDKKSPSRIAGYVSFGLVIMIWLLYFH